MILRGDAFAVKLLGRGMLKVGAEVGSMLVNYVKGRGLAVGGGGAARP